MQKVQDTLDGEKLLKQLQSMDMVSITGNTQKESMADIFAKMSEAKRSKEKIEESLKSTPQYEPPGGWKSNKDRRSNPIAPKTKVAVMNQHSSNRFRLKSPKWDNTMHTSADVLKSLYRIPDRDPSGSLILNLGRDRVTGVVTWSPPIEQDRAFPRVNPSLCASSFRNTLKLHLQETVAKTEVEYLKMPENSDRLSTKRAMVGRDLNNLIQERSFVESVISSSTTPLGSKPSRKSKSAGMPR